ncbi:hypothetical protein NQZ68_012508 [Dissostichus eleginoides]|nr:hypothetical protein NQZ68_012508 [Dissostichus eleginoides]
MSNSAVTQLFSSLMGIKISGSSRGGPPQLQLREAEGQSRSPGLCEPLSAVLNLEPRVTSRPEGGQSRGSQSRGEPGTREGIQDKQGEAEKR